MSSMCQSSSDYAFLSYFLFIQRAMHLLNLPKSLKGKFFCMHDLPTLTFLCLFAIGFPLGHHTKFILLVDFVLVLLIKQMNSKSILPFIVNLKCFGRLIYRKKLCTVLAHRHKLIKGATCSRLISLTIYQKQLYYSAKSAQGSDRPSLKVRIT